MAFSPLESVHRIAPPVQTIPTSQTHPENCYISCKTKAAGLPPYRLMFIFSNADGTAATWRFLYSNLCMELFRQCGLIPIMQSSNAKQKRQGFTRICASNCSASADNSNFANPSGKLLHLTQNKSGRASTIPLDVYFLPTQTARLPQGVFSTRICASNRSANADT